MMALCGRSETGPGGITSLIDSYRLIPEAAVLRERSKPAVDAD